MSAPENNGGHGPGDDVPLSDESMERLAEVLGSEADLDSSEFAEAREAAGLSPESFDELADIAEALEFRGVSREADALPDPDWVKGIVLGPPVAGGLSPEAPVSPEGPATPGQGAQGAKRPPLWLVPMVLAAAALLLWIVRPDPSAGGAGGAGAGGFEGDSGAMLGNGESNEQGARALLLSSSRALVLPLRLSAGDEVRALIRPASTESSWDPIQLKSSEAEISIPNPMWSTLEGEAEYVVDVTVYRLSSGLEERSTFPLFWQP